jgi:hypothetical protein
MATISINPVVDPLNGTVTGYASTDSTSGTLTITGSVTGFIPLTQQVQVELDGIWYSASVNTSTDTWSCSIPDVGTGFSSAVVDNLYTINAKVSGLLGTVATALPVSVTVDNTPPAEKVVITSPSTSTTTAVTISGILGGSLADGTKAGVSPETLQVSTDGGHNWAAVTPNPSTGAWSLSAVLLPGANTVEARVIDAAGNVSSSSDMATQVITVGSVPTEKVTITGIAAATDTGVKGDGITATHLNGDVSSTGPLAVNGTLTSALLPGESLQVSIDGNPPVTVTTFSASGTSWSCTFSGIKQGEHSITADVVNSVGVPGMSSSTLSVNVDNTPPQETELNPITLTNPVSHAPFSGSVEIQGTLSGPLVASTTPGVTAETLQVSIDGGAWQNASVITSGGVTSWSYDATGLSMGAHTVSAQIIDVAGNTTSLVSSESFTTAPPTFSNLSLHMDASSDNGLSLTGPHNTDNITSLATPTMEGSITFSSTADAAAAKAGDLTISLVDTLTGQVVESGIQINVSGTSTVGTFTTAIGTDASGNPVSGIDALSPGNHNIVAELVNQYGVASTATASLLNSQGVAVSPAPGANLVINPQQADVSSQPTANLGLGYSVTAIGDFNGDGYTDYLVSAPASNSTSHSGSTSGAEYLIYGGPNGLPSNLNLNNLTSNQGFKIANNAINGETATQGLTVSAVGDLNGDGYSDVAISSGANNGVYVLFGGNSRVWGRDSGRTPFQLSTIQSGTSTATVGTSANPHGFYVGSYGGAPNVGLSVSGADLNGDGYSDLIIGSSVANSTNNTGAGDAYVIYGHSGPWSNIQVSSNGQTLAGVNPTSGYSVVNTGGSSNGLGNEVQAVGDVTGSGYNDFVVTAPAAAGGSTYSGAAYLVFGGPNVNATSLASLNLNNLTPSQGIMLTATGKNEDLGGITQQNAGGAGSNADSYLPQYPSVSTLGNIDGTGQTAFAIGSPRADNNGNSTYDGAGAVYVIDGTPENTNWSNLTLTPTGLMGKGFVITSTVFNNAIASGSNNLNGSNTGASDLGYSVTNVGDVTGSGLDDFIIGAPMANGGAGAAFLVFGEQGGLPGANTGQVNLDALVAAGKSLPFGTPGTAIEIDGNNGLAYANGHGGAQGVGGYNNGDSYLGTDAAGGDFSGTGLNGYVIGGWNTNTSGTPVTTQTTVGGQGEVLTFNGTTAYLTQSYVNTSNHVYYASHDPTSLNQGGINHIVTGSGNNDWIHGIGAATPGYTPATTGTAAAYQYDVAYGGAGNDHIGIVGTNFTALNGNEGLNTLVFEGNNINLNLAAEGLKVQNFQTFDLNNQENTPLTAPTVDPEGKFTGETTGNTLDLRLSDVLSVGNGDGQLGGATSQHMTILGDSSDTVQLLTSTGALTTNAATSGWTAIGTETLNGITFTEWHNSAATSNASDLLIEQHVNVI